MTPSEAGILFCISAICLFCFGLTINVITMFLSIYYVHRYWGRVTGLNHISCCSYGLEDIWITWIADDEGWDSEELTEGGTELNVVSVEVMYIGLSEDSVVFKLGSSDGWAVGGNEDQSGLSSSESSDGVSVTDLEFTGFNNEGKFGVDVLFPVFGWHGR